MMMVNTDMLASCVGYCGGRGDGDFSEQWRWRSGIRLCVVAVAAVVVVAEEDADVVVVEQKEDLAAAAVGVVVYPRKLTIDLLGNKLLGRC